jgi:hemerythrin-like domain-containing protein
MKATELLMKEHEVIKKSLLVLNKMCDKLQSGKQVDSSHLELIIDFIRNFADKCHHGKEEDILFETMVKVGFQKDSGPISVMLSEHDLGRELVKGFSEAVKLYKEGDMKAISSIIENAHKYSTLLDQHIDKENNILYPMANARLTEELQNNMLKEFEKFEQQKMGQDKHEKLHKILNDLKTIYLT